MRRSIRPQLSLKILLFVLVDLFGMVLLASAEMWLAREQTLFIPGLPRRVGGGHCNGCCWFGRNDLGGGPDIKRVDQAPS